MKDLHGPQTTVHEGACAIKVSMSCPDVFLALLYSARAHGPSSTRDLEVHVCGARLPPQLRSRSRVNAFLGFAWGPSPDLELAVRSKETQYYK